MMILTCTDEMLTKMKKGVSFGGQFVEGLYITDLGIEVLEVQPYRVYESARRVLVRYGCCGVEKAVSLDTLRTRVKHVQKHCGACRKRMKHKDRPKAIRGSRHRPKDDEEMARQQSRDLHLWAHRCMSGMHP